MKGISPVARVAPVRGPATAAVEVRRRSGLDTLHALKPHSLSLLLTDPPYRTVDRHGSHLRRWFRGSLSWTEITAVLRAGRAKLRGDGLAMLVVNEASLPAAQAAVSRAGFARQRLVVWDMRLPGLGNGLRHQVGYIVVGLQATSRTLTGRDLVSVASVPPGRRDRYPTEKPEQLGRALAAIAGIRRGDVVVDPFCGSGNLLVGAVERRASVIAGDTSSKAIRLAKRRLTEAAAQRRLPAAARGRPLLESPPSKARGAYRNSARRRPRATAKPKRGASRRP